MPDNELSIVTGAFGYTGKYITRRLLSMGERVATLTAHADGNPFGDRVLAFPLDFNNPTALRKHMEGAATFYNTYWVRFPRGEITYERAVENTKVLIAAARDAGVRRFVHVSITNASEESPLPYFRGKGRIERALIESGLSHAIVRPTIIFGLGDILINNIAWMLRRFPVFAVIGAGDYRVQPVFVEDAAAIMIDAAHAKADCVIDAVGPETFTFDELVGLIAATVRSRARIVHVRPGVAYLLSKIIGRLVGDVVLTRDEVAGLMAGLLVSDDPPTGPTRLSEWLDRNADRVGTSYASELRRHYVKPGA
jgi:NADH dehydrogenase